MPHLRPGAARELPAGRYVLCEHAPVPFVSSCPPAPRRKMRPAATKAGPWLGCLAVLARGSQSRCPHTNANDRSRVKCCKRSSPCSPALSDPPEMRSEEHTSELQSLRHLV